MQTGSTSLPASGPGCWAWIPVAACALLCWPLLCCCCLVLALTGWLLGPPASNVTPIPELEDLPLIPTKTPVPGSLPLLDPEAEPLFGSARLRGDFSPDPYIVEAVAGGTIDTTTLDLECGYTTSPPAFTFDLSGAETETFLRLFFVPEDGTDSSLLVHTPDGEWLCEQDSLSGPEPVLDFEFAPSGEYAIWLGTPGGEASASGSLSITRSPDTAP